MNHIEPSRAPVGRAVGRAAGVLAGVLAGVGTVVLAGGAAAHRAAELAPPPFVEATHVPPLLTSRGEPIELRYDVYCSRGDGDAGLDVPCEADAAVFARPGDSGAFEELVVREERGVAVGRFVAALPEAIARSASGFSYHASFRSPETGATTRVPEGGADAPQRSLPLARSVDVLLGAHEFGRERRPDARVAEAAWGTGAADVGLENGRNLAPIGGSAFDVEDDGTVVVLDEANKRLLRWPAGGRGTPDAVPLAINGTLADMSIAYDGTVYVLETAGDHGANGVLRAFGRDGAARARIAIAGRPSHVRLGPAGPVVLQSATAQWMPAAIGGRALASSAQAKAARSGRPLADGRRIVVLRIGDEARIAVVGMDGSVRRSWVVRSDTALAEVQLAEAHGTGVVLVARVFTDARAEFVVLVLDRRGVARRFSLDSADWAETAPLSRFRVRGGSLYQLGSTPTGVFVDRFDLDVR